MPVEVIYTYYESLVVTHSAHFSFCQHTPLLQALSCVHATLTYSVEAGTTWASYPAWRALPARLSLCWIRTLPLPNLLPTHQSKDLAKRMPRMSFGKATSIPSPAPNADAALRLPGKPTGKRLSTPQVMMDLRARMKEKGPLMLKNGRDYSDGKSLIRDYISEEELWACTTCKRLPQECPSTLTIHLDCGYAPLSGHGGGLSTRRNKGNV